MGHAVVCAILVRDGRVLLCHRAPEREWYPNVWDFPGGHVEAGESQLEALHREVREELGVALGAVSRGSQVALGATSDGTRLTAWIATEWTGTVANCAPHEHDALGWFVSDDLDELVFADPSYVELLRKVLDDYGTETRDTDCVGR